jgi:hypothetical protein
MPEAGTYQWFFLVPIFGFVFLLTLHKLYTILVHMISTFILLKLMLMLLICFGTYRLKWKIFCLWMLLWWTSHNTIRLYLLLSVGVPSQQWSVLIRRISKTTKKATITWLRHVRPSICPYRTTRLQPEGFLCKLIVEYFFKICRENSRCIKIGQEKQVLYMKTHIHCWSYLAHIFLEWEMFQKRVVQKIKTHILCAITSFRKLCC